MPHASEPPSLSNFETTPHVPGPICSSRCIVLPYISNKIGITSHTGAEHSGREEALNPATQLQKFALHSQHHHRMTSTITLDTPHDTLMRQKLILQSIHRDYVYWRVVLKTALVCKCVDRCRIIEKSVTWPCFWVLLSTPTPYFKLKPCYLQSEGILLNQGRNLVPQYLMHKISSNYGSNKHSSSEGTQEKRER
jgi:hypothetical protein